MLLDIKAYLQERKQATLRDLSIHFDVNPEAMRGMLDKWIQKGRVAKISAAACGGCASNCATAEQEETYEWLERPQRFIQIQKQ